MNSNGHRYEVLGGYDGVFETLLASAPTFDGAKDAVRYLRRRGYKLDNLAIADAETGRLVSFVL